MVGLGLILNIPPLFVKTGYQESFLGLQSGSLTGILTLADGSLASLLVEPGVYDVLGFLASTGRQDFYMTRILKIASSRRKILPVPPTPA